jgi:eukaryotic-like serine/threonine-protein kinase
MRIAEAYCTATQKPSNMLLGKFGETLLLDWGLAKLIDQPDVPEPGTSQTDRLDRTSGSTAGATLAGTAVGTPRYMSPEQASGRSEDIGPASDVYELGATLYCLLTGQAPLSELTKIGSILQAAAAGEIPAPRTLSRHVPRTLESICQKAMALRPEERYTSATALAEDLEHWRAGEPVEGVAEGFGPRLTRWEQRHRLLIRIGGLALLTLATIGGAAAMLVNIAREQTDQRRREAEEQRHNADQERATAQSLAARLAIDRGQRLCDESDGHEGLLWMIRSLELAASNEPLQNAIHRNIEGWLPAQH